MSVEVRGGGDVEVEASTPEVREVSSDDEGQGKVEVSEHPAQMVTVVAHSRPQVATVWVTVLACSC